MDKALRSHLLTCFDLFRRSSNISPATIAARAAGDWRFFERLNDLEKTFTIKKYEEIMRWFLDNWPSQIEWPRDIPKPSDQATSHAA